MSDLCLACEIKMYNPCFIGCIMCQSIHSVKSASARVGSILRPDAHRLQGMVEPMLLCCCAFVKR